MLSKEQRAFLAGCVHTKSLETDSRLDGSGIAQGVTSLLEPEGGAKELTVASLMAQFREWSDADDNAHDAALASQGPNVSKAINEWGPPEWSAAVTGLAMYRYYLQRELSAANDFLSCAYVQNAPALGQLANDAANACRERLSPDNMPMVDPGWARRLLRRIHKEAKAVIG